MAYWARRRDPAVTAYLGDVSHVGCVATLINCLDSVLYCWLGIYLWMLCTDVEERCEHERANSERYPSK